MEREPAQVVPVVKAPTSETMRRRVLEHDRRQPQWLPNFSQMRALPTVPNMTDLRRPPAA